MKSLSVPDPRIYLSKAVLELKKGNIKDAVNILLGIEANFPEICEASYYLFEAYTRLGDEVKRKESFEKIMLRCNEFYKRRALLVSKPK